MEHDEGAPDAASPDEGDTGPRRSTFTPAPADAYEKFAATASDFSVPADFVVPPDAPPPNPSTLVTPPPGSALPRPPQRRSLDDDELVSTLDRQDLRDGGVLDAIEQLQAQLRIREQEAREFRIWESSMLAIGTREALDVVEETRVTFTGAIQVIPPADPEPAVYELVEPEVSPRTTGSNIVLPGDAPAVDRDLDELDANMTDIAPPVAPVVSPRTEPGETVIAPDAPTVTQKAFSPETSGMDPAPPEQRTGRALRLFWLWFAANSSVLSLVLGGVLLSLGMSLRQAIVAALAGVALSFLPIGLGTLAGKWSGQPTMVASRAAFGLAGNVVPGVLSLVTRILWGAALLWLFAFVTARLLVAADASAGLSVDQLAIAAAAGGFLLCLIVAFFGYRLVSLVQLVLSVASGLLVIALIAVSWPLVDFSVALTIGDGSWTLVLTGLILVFSLVGLVWSTSSGDLARYQRPAGAGAGSMITASFGNALPAFGLIAYGALLAASDPDRAASFATDPVTTLAGTVPTWFLVPLIAAVGIGLLSGVALSMYSGGFSLVAIAPLRRDLAVLLIGVLLGGVAVLLSVLQVDLAEICRDVATTLAVPTAAWLGIFAADIMIRHRRYNTRSLVQRGGMYADVNWTSLGILAVASAAGFGFTTASASGLAWQGYLLELMGIPVSSDLAQSDFGVLVALAIALLGVILFGVRTIRRQEEARS